MKKKLILLPMIIWVHLVNAQYSKICEFNGEPYVKNPYYSQPVSDGTYIYDMTSGGGTYDKGAIFRVKPDGSNFSIIFNFDGTNGSDPRGSLIRSGSILYGMTSHGGANDMGCIFKINTDGTGYTKLLDFDGTNGSYPLGSLFLGGFLYGMTSQGGSNNLGCIFRLNTDGTGYTKLLDFNGTSNGSTPYGSLVTDGSYFYAMTYAGGANGYGCIFKIDANGNGYSRLYSFNYSTSECCRPYGSLTIAGNNLYGMASTGGTNNCGGIFKIKTNGTGFTMLLNFKSSPTGYMPYGSLELLGNTLYSMNSAGGANLVGCVFSIDTLGSGFTKLIDFNGANGGAVPYGSLSLLDASTLCGLTSSGGTANSGCIFKITTSGTYTKILDFNKPLNGQHPMGSVIVTGDTIFGMNYEGGAYNYGCIYRLKTDGTGFTKLLDFSGTGNGANPMGALSISGNVLYGMTNKGGSSNNYGCIFKINTDGSGYTKMASFNGSNGAFPYGSSLVPDDTVLYGMTEADLSNHGCIFKIKKNGTVIKKFHSFSEAGDGSYPYGSLVLSDNLLYGMTEMGGANDSGCIFRIDINGNNYLKIFDFKSKENGGYPYGSLIISGDTLFGMTSKGGTNDLGTIFRIKTNGTDFIKLLDFNGSDNGSSPAGSLILIGNVLYGTTPSGGSGNNGCIFKINTDGTGYSKLIDFSLSTGTSAGYVTLVSDGTYLYGTTSNGGNNSNGVVFKYLIAPAIQSTNIVSSSHTITQTTLSWTNGSGEKRAVFLKHTTGTITNPVNNTTYIASADWSSKGTELDTSGYYCVYNGTGNSVTITNLTSNCEYVIEVFEYNGDTGEEQYLTTTTIGNPATFNTFKFNPIITWNKPSDITYGTLLDTAQLNAAADVEGTFVYTPASGTKLNAGNGQTLQADFTPIDDVNYNTTSKTITINVAKGTPLITWSDPNDISYGTLLSDIQLNATSNVPGIFTYTPVSGTKLDIGNDQLLQVYFTPTDIANYNTVSKTVTINVNTKLTPVITWNAPADITYGTLLSTTQLNAKADVPGIFTYTPPVETKLEIGNDQDLRVDFKPTDTTNYNNASKIVYINVIGSTGNEELTKDEGLLVFPNPFTDKIFIQSKEVIYEISIFDCSGMKMMEINSNSCEMELPLNNLSDGIWLLEVKTKTQTRIFKIIKSKN
jgi:uncharacterized repeat protein (TIGR03803 family)